MTLKPGIPVSIRMADAGDAGMLTELGRRTFHETFAAHNTADDIDAYMREAFVVERVVEELRQPGSVFLVAEALSKPVGFARLEPAHAPECVTGPSPVRLVKLYVSAEAIGSGFGAALMSSSIAWARKAGHGSLWLGVWEHNYRARAFYERWGFRPVGTEAFRLGSDDQVDVLMEWRLGEDA